jgi:RNA polymerase sigma-70 factor, ECF subfamily
MLVVPFSGADFGMGSHPGPSGVGRIGVAMVEPEPVSERRSPGLDGQCDPARLRRAAAQHLDFVWRCLRRFGVPSADADDAAQQVFMVAAQKLDEVPEDKERAFLFATSARIAANARRSLRRREHAYDNLAHAPDDPVESQEQLADQLRARALLDQVMEMMPEDLREVFVLFEIEEFAIHEIADTLGIPVGTVGSRLRRARKAFSEAVIRYKAKAEFRRGTR